MNREQIVVFLVKGFEGGVLIDVLAGNGRIVENELVVDLLFELEELFAGHGEDGVGFDGAAERGRAVEHGCLLVVVHGVEGLEVLLDDVVVGGLVRVVVVVVSVFCGSGFEQFFEVAAAHEQHPDVDDDDHEPDA